MNRALLVIGIVGLLFFNLVPNIDLTIASLFWGPGWGGQSGWYAWVHDGIYWLAPALLLVLMIMLLVSMFHPIKNVRSKAIIFLMLCIILGPGLVVNGIFKDHWGRPRPEQMIQFNGQEDYVYPFMISDACQKDCSFVSGHSSFGFVFLALAYVVSRYRYLYVASAFLLGWLVGYVRMVQGGHFFSDVFFAWLITWSVVHCTYVIMAKLGNDVAKE